MDERFNFRAWSKECNSIEYDIEDPLECERCFSEILKDKGYVIMQCTGLRDKNGKLIFEGDIIKTKTGFMVVSFYKEKCQFIKRKWGLPIPANWDLIYDGVDEVAGNRFENSELLKETEK